MCIIIIIIIIIIIMVLRPCLYSHLGSGCS